MTQKNYGLILEPIQPEDFIRGTERSLEAKFGAPAINPEGDWSPYLPIHENQDTSNGDTFACTVFGTTNAIEMLARCIFKK